MADTLDVAALEREHLELVQRIWAANDDLAERMNALGVTTDYDAELDILFTRIGPPVEALTESVDDHVGLRVDPDTLKIVGWEILEPRTASAAVFAIAMLLVTLFAVAHYREHPPAEPTRLRLYTQLATDLRSLARAA
jgi:hypothetical protein